MALGGGTLRFHEINRKHGERVEWQKQSSQLAGVCCSSANTPPRHRWRGCLPHQQHHDSRCQEKNNKSSDIDILWQFFFPNISGSTFFFSNHLGCFWIGEVFFLETWNGVAEKSELSEWWESYHVFFWGGLLLRGIVIVSWVTRMWSNAPWHGNLVFTNQYYILSLFIICLLFFPGSSELYFGIPPPKKKTTNNFSTIMQARLCSEIPPKKQISPRKANILKLGWTRCHFFQKWKKSCVVVCCMSFQDDWIIDSFPISQDEFFWFSSSGVDWSHQHAMTELRRSHHDHWEVVFL